MHQPAPGQRPPFRASALVIATMLATACAGTIPPASSSSQPAATPMSSPTAVPSSTPRSVTATPTAPPAGEIVLAKSEVSRAPATPADAKAAADAINAFGFDLYGQIAEPGQNAVFSPASIVLALGMARAGAGSETAAEMDAVMHEVASDEHPGWLNGLERELSDRDRTFPLDGNEDEPARLTLRIANAQFAQTGMGLEEAYLDALASRFGAGLRQVDYRNDPETVRRLINAWVGDQTEQRIPELLGESDVKRDTRLALVNAIYLKAPWALPFQAEATRAGRFTRLDGTRVSVPMMHDVSTSATRRATVTEDWQAVELTYRGETLSMLLIVPRDLDDFEEELGPRLLADIDDALDDKYVDLTMPRFGIETKARLGDALVAMGMPLAFDPETADFSAITRDADLYIDRVIHQANIDVDEKGTEAAAATAVLMGDTAGGADVEPIVIRADRPFLFALRDVPTGAILFLGRVADPLSGR